MDHLLVSIYLVAAPPLTPAMGLVLSREVASLLSVVASRVFLEPEVAAAAVALTERESKALRHHAASDKHLSRLKALKTSSTAYTDAAGGTTP